MCKHKNDGNFLMEIDGLKCELNMPDALKSTGSDGDEKTWDLPPYKRVMAYKVDEFPACPSNWIHGSAKASSYFLGIEEGKGMWLDFNGCVKDEHDVAVLISIQGVNPITGQKQDKMCLEQYREKCPVHDVEFQQDRYCPECEYKWPAQNYMTTSSTPGGLFWLDGFRSEDGKVRQYLFTEEEVRGIAHQVIGKENKCYAIGVAFFRSKDKKPVLQKMSRGPSGQSGKPSVYPMGVNDYAWQKFDHAKINHVDGIWVSNNENITKIGCLPNDHEIKTGSGFYSCQNVQSLSKKEASEKRPGIADRNVLRSMSTKMMPAASMLPEDELPVADFDFMDDPVLDRDAMITSDGSEIKEVEVTKKYEVGAGALIKQQVYADSKDLDYYEDEPAGFVYINYADVESVMKILDAGKRGDKKDGYMNGLKVGN